MDESDRDDIASVGGIDGRLGRDLSTARDHAETRLLGLTRPCHKEHAVFELVTDIAGLENHEHVR